MDTNSQTDKFSLNSRGQPKRGTLSMYKSNLDSQVQRMSSGEKVGLPVVGCMPGCTIDHEHNFDYDYSKNYKDAMNRRPGEFVEYNWMAYNYNHLSDDSKAIVCDGNNQTPINLDTNIPISKEFKDYSFEFQYNTIDPKTQVKFNQKGQ